MATTRAQNAKIAFNVYNDKSIEAGSMEYAEEEATEVEDQEDDEDDQEDSQPSNNTHYDSDDSEESVNDSVEKDINKFKHTIPGIGSRFRLIKRIGEGTFSTVYKAEDLGYDDYRNSWDVDERDRSSKWSSPPLKKQLLGKEWLPSMADNQTRKPRFVAIKKIYVTSSPARILNELELLNALRGCDSVCPLITAFRHADQVVAVLPYFRHTDFREYFRHMNVSDMKIYFRSLFTALQAVHAVNILHRDIKPTNFLYEMEKKRGVLVDFGLAEREGTDCKPCLCMESSMDRRRRIHASVAGSLGPSNGYPKNETRPSRRANRAGTRGFRAPEVLFKCTEQSTAIDIWSAGVILLTILSRRFPFFNSTDDVEATIEIATIFGSKRMKQCASLHGTMFETNIATIGLNGFALEKIILWSTGRTETDRGQGVLRADEKLAVKFLERCLELDPNKRITAEEALEHEFLREDLTTDEEDEMQML